MKVVAIFAFLFVAAVVGDRQFERINKAMTYPEAKKFCESQGRDYSLYLPRNDEENKALYAQMKKDNVIDAWIGLEVAGNESREFVDEKGFLVDPKYWGPGEPNNNGGHENCGEMRVLDKNTPLSNWNDTPCDNVYPFYCGKVEIESDEN